MSFLHCCCKRMKVVKYGHLVKDEWQNSLCKVGRKSKYLSLRAQQHCHETAKRRSLPTFLFLSILWHCLLYRHLPRYISWIFRPLCLHSFHLGSLQAETVIPPSVSSVSPNFVLHIRMITSNSRADYPYISASNALEWVFSPVALFLFAQIALTHLRKDNICNCVLSFLGRCSENNGLLTVSGRLIPWEQLISTFYFS